MQVQQFAYRHLLTDLWVYLGCGYPEIYLQAVYSEYDIFYGLSMSQGVH